MRAVPQSPDWTLHAAFGPCLPMLRRGRCYLGGSRRSKALVNATNVTAGTLVRRCHDGS